MPNKLTTFALSALVLTLVACNDEHVTASSLEGQIGRAISEKCHESPNCTVQLRELTPFEWDRMFYFDTVPPADRQKAVGVQIKTEEFRRQLVFLRDGKIVRNELLPTDVEKPVENEIAFQAGDRYGFMTCDREAVFAATRGDEGTGIPFFQLKALSAEHCR